MAAKNLPAGKERPNQTSQLSAMVYPNTVKHAFGYDNRDRATSLAVTAGSTTIASYAQTFAPSGHKTNMTESPGRAPTYQYDAIWRLIQEQISSDSVAANNGTLAYVLDPVGNRQSLASSLAAAPNQSFSYDADDRTLSDIYEANGNTLTSGARLQHPLPSPSTSPLREPILTNSTTQRAGTTR